MGSTYKIRYTGLARMCEGNISKILNFSYNVTQNGVPLSQFEFISLLLSGNLDKFSMTAAPNYWMCDERWNKRVLFGTKPEKQSEGSSVQKTNINVMCITD